LFFEVQVKVLSGYHQYVSGDESMQIWLVINAHKPEMVTLGVGLMMGVFTGFFFSMLTTGINYLYQRKSFVLWLIDGCYVVIGLGIAGMILAV
jgi:hypothetical protein